MAWTPHPIEAGESRSLSQLGEADPVARRLLHRSAIYPFAGLHLPDHLFGPSFAYFGQIGSGKTLEMRMLMRHALGPIQYGDRTMLRHRALCYDHKGQDVIGDLRTWCPESLLVELHPYSENGVALHLGKSCTTLEDCEQLGYVMIPESEKTHDFFNPAAQQLIQAVIQTLFLHGKDWTSLDIVVACTDGQLLRHVLSHHPRGPSLIAEYLPTKLDTSQNIIQTMIVKLAPWRTAGLLERRSEHYITVDGWLNSGAVVVLRGSSRNPDTIDRYNAFAFKLMVSRLRAREANYPIDESFVFVDEMPENILTDYRDALLLGRIKGVRTAATIQDPAGLINRFGSKEKASEIMGQLGNLCTGRIASPDSAEWLAKFFGKYQYWQRKESHSYDGHRQTTSVAHDLREEFNVYPYDLQDFPKASLEQGYEVVARTPALRPWRAHVSPQFIRDNLGDLPPRAADTRWRVLSREDVAYTWDKSDLKRLGLRSAAATRPPKDRGPRQLKLP